MFHVEHCFIENDDVRTVDVPATLDKSWYINLAEKRIEDFGINLSSDSLFDF
jgi:DNA polymerase